VKTLLCVLGGALALASPAMGAARPYDFNGDHRQELAVGLPAWHTQSTFNVGAVLAVQTAKSGLVPSAQLLTRGRDGFPGAPAANEQLGRAVAGGDFNGDGRSDLAMLRGSFTTGMVVVSGSASGLARATARNYAAPYLTLPTSADVNHDGFFDLAVRSNGSPTRVRIYRGSATGLGSNPAATLAIAPNAMRLGDLNRDGRPELVYSTFDEIGVCGGTATGPADCHSIPAVGGGSDLAVGDVTGGRGREVVLGVPSDSLGGAVYVYRFVAGELRFSFRVTQDSRGVPGHSQSEDLFGQTVEVLRVGRRKKETIAIGAPGEDGNEGRVTLVHGAKRRYSKRGNRAISLDTPGVPGEADDSERFGVTLASLDHTGDGRFELDVGTPFEGAGHVISFRNSRKGLKRKARSIGLGNLGFSPDKELTFGAVVGRR
jgi:hypothetical protein